VLPYASPIMMEVIIIWVGLLTSSFFTILMCYRHSHSALLASSVMVLSLAIGAFMQQAIRNIPCEISVPGSNATIAVAQYAHPWLNDSVVDWSRWDDVYLSNFDPSTKTRILSALSSRDATRPTFLKNCSTGNCTFSSVNGVTHVTSGFCSRCVETTNSLRYDRGFGYNDLRIQSVLRPDNNPSLMLVFDEGLRIFIGMAVNGHGKALEALHESMPDGYTAAINVASLTDAPCSQDTQCSNIWNETARDWGWWQYNVVSVSCGLYPCARHMTAEVRNGDFKETVVLEEPYEFYLHDRMMHAYNGPLKTFSKRVAFHAPCWVNGTRYDKPPGNMTVTTDWETRNVEIPLCAFGVSEAFYYQVKNLMNSTVSGNCTVNRNSIIAQCRRATRNLDDDICHDQNDPFCDTELWWLQNLFNSGNASFESISTTVANIAMAITDSARVQPFPSVSYVPGTIWTTTICTEFNWPWLIFPAALIILAAGSLASIAMWDAWGPYGPPVWKSSLLPFMLRDEQNREMSTKGSSIKDLEYIANENDLMLQREDNRWKFMVSPSAERTGRRASF
jgi:hypothetical protein